MAFIRTFSRLHGYPPTYREIADSFGFASVNAVQTHIKALQAKGLVTHVQGKSRTIKLTIRE